ncbi:MAG: transcription antitermination factor NusB [Thermoanaerobaculia bacterium]
MAREMAMQMLFQSDQGSTPHPLVLNSFDPHDFASRLAVEPEEEGDDLRGADLPPGAESLPPESAPTTRRVPAVAAEIDEAFAYARRIVEGVHRDLEAIDGKIRSQADNWRLERMPSVDRNILRLAVYELVHEPDIPKLVVLDEAVELAKRYGSEQSSRFVNGLLDGILRRHELPGSRV